MRISNELFSHLFFRLAEGPVRDECISLRASIYSSELGHHGADEFDAQSRHVVATTAEGEIVGACRMIGPEIRPLEIEGFVDLDSLLGPKSVPAQIGGLWIAPTSRRVRTGQLLPLALMRCLLHLAQGLGVTDIVLRTHVDQVKPLYSRAGFREQPELAFKHPKWGAVYVMSMNLGTLEESARRTRDPIRLFLVEGALENVAESITHPDR